MNYRLKARQSGWYVCQRGQVLDLSPEPDTALLVPTKDAVRGLLVAAEESTEIQGVLLDIEEI